MLFKTSEDAYRAFFVRKNIDLLAGIRVLKVLPADTWRQPKPIVDENIKPDLCTITNLNDDCLLHVLKCLHLVELIEVADVCMRFRKLLEWHLFPKVDFYAVYTINWPMEKLRKTLKRIGPHLTHLHIEYPKYRAVDANFLRKDFEERITNLIKKNIGDKLKKLKISYEESRFVPVDLLRILAPILQRIEILIWNAASDCQTIETLHSFCQNLKSLKLARRQLACKHDTQMIHLNWPSLKHLEIDQYFERLEYDCNSNLNEFINSNPQLEQIKLTNVSELLFDDALKHSMNLKHLDMVQHNNTFNVSETHSRGFGSLECIILREKSTATQMELIDRLKCFQLLPKLKLIILISNFCRGRWIPFAHKWTNVRLEGDEVEIEIGSNTAKIELSQKEQITLVNVINTHPHQLRMWKDSKSDLMNMFHRTEFYFPDTDNLRIWENDDCCQFIHVSRKSK